MGDTGIHHRSEQHPYVVRSISGSRKSERILKSAQLISQGVAILSSPTPPVVDFEIILESLNERKHIRDVISN